MTTFAELNEEVTRTKADLARVEKELASVREALDNANTTIMNKDRALMSSTAMEVSLRDRVHQLEAKVTQVADDLWDRLVVARAAVTGISPREAIAYADEVIAARIGKFSQKISKKSANGATTPTG